MTVALEMKIHLMMRIFFVRNPTKDVQRECVTSKVKCQVSF